MPNDQYLRQTAAGTYSLLIPAGAGAGVVTTTVVSSTTANGTANGTPAFLHNALIVGNSANATIAANSVMEIYAGNAVAAGKLVLTLGGNSGLAAPTIVNYPLGADTGNLTVRTFGNTAQCWLTWGGTQSGGY